MEERRYYPSNPGSEPSGSEETGGNPGQSPENKEMDPGAVSRELLQLLEAEHYKGYAIRLEYYDRDGVRKRKMEMQRLGLFEDKTQEDSSELLNIYLLPTGKQLKGNFGEFELLIVDWEGFEGVPQFWKGRIWSGLKTANELQSWLDQVLAGRASLFVFKRPPLPAGKFIEIARTKEGDTSYIRLEEPILDPKEASVLVIGALEYNKRREEELKRQRYEVAKAALEAIKDFRKREGGQIN